jgi:hypothetical protein
MSNQSAAKLKDKKRNAFWGGFFSSFYCEPLSREEIEALKRGLDKLQNEFSSKNSPLSSLLNDYNSISKDFQKAGEKVSKAFLGLSELNALPEAWKLNKELFNSNLAFLADSERVKQGFTQSRALNEESNDGKKDSSDK